MFSRPGLIRFRFLALLLPGFVGVVLLAPRVGSTENEEKNVNSISAVRAYFYFAESGRFGTLDLLDPSRALWNTPSGGGDAQEPSEATLVLVELSGPAFKRASSGKLNLLARTTTRRVSRQSVELSDWLGQDQKVTVPFLIYGTGCEPLTLEVWLSGVQRSEPLKLVRQIPFQCGE